MATWHSLAAARPQLHRVLWPAAAALEGNTMRGYRAVVQELADLTLLYSSAVQGGGV